MASMLKIQQQLNEITEKYHALRQKTKLLQLEKAEYAKELQKLSVKDDESEYTIHELTRQKIETEQQQTWLYTVSQSNEELFENEHDINQQLRLKSQENMKKINNLTTENENIKQTNQKYKHELKNTNEKIIKLENENKTKTKQNQQQTAEIEFLSAEIQTLQSCLTNNFAGNQPTLEIIDSTGPSPLISQKTPGFKLDISSVPSNNINNKFTRTCRSTCNTLQYAYQFANINKADTLRSNISEYDGDGDGDNDGMFTDRFDRYWSMRNAIVTPDINNIINVDNDTDTDNEVFVGAMNKQRMEYEILFQSLNDENEELNCNIKTLNDEKDELVGEYNDLLKSNKEYIARIKLYQSKSFWNFFPCVLDKI